MAQYLLDKGLRRVKPYYFRHSTNCKGRWFNRTVAEVFASEFRERPLEYYLAQISNGNFKVFTRGGITVVKEKLVDYKIHNGDRIEYTDHQHEPVVPDSKISIVHEDENLVVANKPSGIPVHPTQKYFYNSVSEIIKAEFDFETLYACHRLDKLTSGVLIFGKTNTAAAHIQKKIQNKIAVEKLYLARVSGNFPDTELVCEDPIVNIQTKKSFSTGVPEAKPATTIFNKVSYNEALDQSVVQCQPITGRTHQIRIHLRNLGHPICNDPLYGQGNLLSKTQNDIDHQAFINLQKRAERNRDSLLTEGVCQDCHVRLFKDYAPENLSMWLHSLRYKVGELTFETEWPEWAQIR